MHPTLEKEKELCSYLEDWVLARYGDWREFYNVTSRDRKYGIYNLESGTKLMDLLIDIMGNIEDNLLLEPGKHLIPTKFSSISQLLHFLNNFNNHLKNSFYLIEKNLKGEYTSMIIGEMYSMCNDIDQMVTRCQSIYLTDEDTPIPYQQAKSALLHNDVKTFVELLQSIISSVPYNIHKEKLDEGYFHTIIHVITSVLGMSPLSEVETNDGRIDMEIEFPNRVFVLEFKFSEDGQDRSEEALIQIKEKQYAKRSYIKGKIIKGVGISFSQAVRNINAYKQEELYIPQTSLFNNPVV